MIEADIVILATNAAIKHFGYWRDGLVTIYTYAGISAAMTTEDAGQLGFPPGVCCRRIGWAPRCGGGRQPHDGAVALCL